MKNNNETHNQYQESFKKIKKTIKSIKNRDISDDKKEKKYLINFVVFYQKIYQQMQNCQLLLMKFPKS